MTEQQTEQLGRSGQSLSSQWFFAATVVIAAFLAMGASDPQGELIDSRRYGEEATAIVKPYSVPERAGAVVTAVRGIAQWRSGEGKPWAAVRVGQRFEGPAEFRTGVRSEVTLSVVPDQTITIDRLGLVRLLQRVDAEGKVRFELDRARMNFKAEPAGPNDMTITTPGRTLAIRG